MWMTPLCNREETNLTSNTGSERTELERWDQTPDLSPLTGSEDVALATERLLTRRGQCAGADGLCYSLLYINCKLGWGSRLVERRAGRPLRQVRFPGAARDFSPRVNFHCTLSHVYPPRCATVCINICAHVKNLVVRARVRWITETLKHPAST